MGYIEEPPPEGWSSWEAWATQMGIPEERWNDQSAILDPEGNGPRIFFQKVPEGKAAKNRVHLDVRSAPGLDGDARRARLNERAEELVGLGATRLYEKEEMRDVLGDDARPGGQRVLPGLMQQPGNRRTQSDANTHILLERRRDVPVVSTAGGSENRSPSWSSNVPPPSILDPNRPLEDQRNLSLLGSPTDRAFARS